MSSSYCTRSDIESRYGPDNVKLWADLDNRGDDTAISNRITEAIDSVSDYIDGLARRLGYTIPLRDETGNTPRTLRDIAATLAGVWLYESRGIKDVDPEKGQPVHRLAWQRRWALQRLTNLLTGLLAVGLTRAVGQAPEYRGDDTVTKDVSTAMGSGTASGDTT